MNRLPLSPRAPSQLQIVAVCATICASLLFAASTTNAQDVAEAAHQEKARKSAQPQKQLHVYTNEDLKRSQILTPEDRTIVEARKKNAAPPAVNETSPETVLTQDATATESLGEIARRLRKEKTARQAEQARKVPPPSPFPMELPHETTLVRSKPLHPALIAPSPSPSKAVKPPASTGSTKRDPFSRAVISAAPRSNSISAPMPTSSSPPASAPLSLVAPPATVHSPSGVSKNRPGSVRIRPGDSLWNLSRQYLGKGSRWQEWLSHNPGIGDPRHMQSGAVLFIPPLENKPSGLSDSQASSHASAQLAATISVQPGDSLWKIAAKRLGSGAAWSCLAHANPDLRDVALIYPGQKLMLPASCAKAMPTSPKE